MRVMLIGPLAGHGREAARLALARGARVVEAESLEIALSALRSGRGADLALIDARLDVAAFLADLAAERIGLPVIACGVAHDAQAAVRAVRAGARDYIPLPPDPDMIAAVLASIADEDRPMIAADPAMAAVLRLAERVAPSEATVLITGESGTGKEVLARFLHRRSRRADKPFVSLNCAAIPEALLESELFGHEKGAFTGAVARRIGRFEEASGGTLLLDEVTEMDPRLQAKLLRALQERVIDRVGGTQPVKVDIRVIATSNRDMEAAVRAGQFRDDLYFRLSVMTLDLPPLRARPADIAPLARHFVNKYAQLNQTGPRHLSPAALDQLTGHHWRGNVRELENTIHRAVLLAGGPEIGPEAIVLQGAAPVPLRPAVPLPGEPAAAPSGGAVAPAGAATAAVTSAKPVGGPAAEGTRGLVGRTVADVERDLIIDTLQHTAGNRTHAATILGISIRTLRNKLKQYMDEGVAVPPPGAAERAAW